MKKKDINAYRRLIIMCSIVLIGPRDLKAAGHYVEILTPSQNQAFNDLYYQDYIPFTFRVHNDDNYYLTYDEVVQEAIRQQHPSEYYSVVLGKIYLCFP